ncbi:uncharacterized protein LOC100378937 [Saccoglossus kowalevskii]
MIPVFSDTRVCGSQVSIVILIFLSSRCIYAQLDLGALFTSPIVQYECPDGYTLRGSSCYKSVTSRQSWVNAENTCQGHGGHLTAVEGYSENLYVGAQILEDVKNDYDSPEVDDIDDCWLGFTGPNPAGSNEYDYADGRKATVFDGRWSDTQPNEEDGACVELHLYENNYPWYHSPCIQMSPFVCEIGACAEGEFRCTNGACINPDWVCDGTVDCGGGDFSDEIGCAEDCGGFQTGTSGTIQTSGYPDNNYDILQECVWIIEGPATSKIKIKFLDLVTEKDHDIVEVIDGPVYDASKVLATYSGTGTPDEVVITSTNSMTVKFHSDSTTTKSGFTADWEAIFSTCGGEFIAEVHKKNLSSTEYFEEKNYLNSEDCNWQLDSYSAQTVITLQFVTFETQEDTDMISVFDGEDAGAAHVLALFSGSELPNVVISSKHQMRVDFKSDDTVTMRGFHAWYWAGCQGIEIVRSHGYISTPGYGVNDYPGEIMCTWAIEEPSGKPLTLIFDDAFELELNTDADFVTVYDGIDDSGDILTGPWSGNSGTVTDGTLPPPNSRSENGMFYVVFTSSQQRNAMGFRARFSPDCPAIDIGDGVIASTNERGYGTVVQYSCLPGFTKPSRTVDSLTCEYGGEWNEGDNSKYPSCSRVRCGIPPDATNAFFYNVSSIAYQGVVSYRCVEGYTFSSSAMSMVCQANGTWGPEIPSCEPVVCPGPSMPDPMTYVVVGGGDDLIYGVTISFECPDGYNVIGFTSSICGSDGEWTADPGDCQRINCSELVITDLNMDATPDIGPYYAGDNITFICQSGYQIDGPTYITCNDDTQWSDSPPTCTDINECETDTDSCGLNQICQNTNGGYECLCVNGFEVDESGDSCSDINECADDDLNACNIYSECNNIDGGYTCDCFNGYILFTTDGTSGFYIPPGESGLSIGDMYVFNKSCVPLTCILPNINDAVVIPRTRTVYSIAGLLLIELNVTLTVICNPGYQLNGQNILTCQSDGEYDYNLPTCEAVSCGKPEDIANGMVQVSDPAYGYFSRSSYSCDSGYNIYGPTVRMCIKDGSEYKWSSYPPTCIAVDCGNVTLVTDGSWSYSNGSQYGSIATLTCDDGYGPLGDDERTCMEDGSWSGIPAQCTIIGVCDDPGMVQNGQRLGDDFSVGSTVSYTCDFGFTPTHYLSLICEGREVTVIPTIPTTTKEAESTTTTTTATTTEEEASSTTTTTTAPVATTTTTTTPPTTEEEASSTTTTTTAATTIITEEEASSTRTSTSARATTKTSTDQPSCVLDGTHVTAIAESSDLQGFNECSFADYYTDQDYIAGMAVLNSAAYCGQCIRVTGPNGASVTVRVADNCHMSNCRTSNDDIVLRPEAFGLLVDDGSDSANVTYLTVACPDETNIKLKLVSSGGSFRILILDHRYPVTSVEAEVSGTWVTFVRSSNNLFDPPSGSSNLVPPLNVKIHSDKGQTTYTLDEYKYGDIIDTGEITDIETVTKEIQVTETIEITTSKPAKSTLLTSRTIGVTEPIVTERTDRTTLQPEITTRTEPTSTTTFHPEETSVVTDSIEITTKSLDAQTTVTMPRTYSTITTVAEETYYETVTTEVDEIITADDASASTYVTTPVAVQTVATTLTPVVTEPRLSTRAITEVSSSKPSVTKTKTYVPTDTTQAIDTTQTSSVPFTIVPHTSTKASTAGKISTTVKQETETEFETLTVEEEFTVAVTDVTESREVTSPVVTVSRTSTRAVTPIVTESRTSTRAVTEASTSTPAATNERTTAHVPIETTQTIDTTQTHLVPVTTVPHSSPKASLTTIKQETGTQFETLTVDEEFTVAVTDVTELREVTTPVVTKSRTSSRAVTPIVTESRTLTLAVTESSTSTPTATNERTTAHVPIETTQTIDTTQTHSVPVTTVPHSSPKASTTGKVLTTIKQETGTQFETLTVDEEFTVAVTDVTESREITTPVVTEPTTSTRAVTPIVTESRTSTRAVTEASTSTQAATNDRTTARVPIETTQPIDTTQTYSVPMTTVPHSSPKASTTEKVSTTAKRETETQFATLTVDEEFTVTATESRDVTTPVVTDPRTSTRAMTGASTSTSPAVKTDTSTLAPEVTQAKTTLPTRTEVRASQSRVTKSRTSVTEQSETEEYTVTMDDEGTELIETTTERESSTQLVTETTVSDRCVLANPISAIGEPSSLPGIGECSFGDYYTSDLGGMATLNTATRCGQCMEVTGPSGVTVIVRVVDTCPFDKCMSWDDIVLSPDSFTDIVHDDATTSVDVTYTIVACPGDENIKLKIMESSSGSPPFGLVVLDHRYPVTSVTVQSRGGWVTLYRMSNNVFKLPADSEGTWTSFNVKVYSDYGHITYRVDQITYNVAIDTGKQFRLCKNGQNVIETTMPQHTTVTDLKTKSTSEEVTGTVTKDVDVTAGEETKVVTNTPSVSTKEYETVYETEIVEEEVTELRKTTAMDELIETTVIDDLIETTVMDDLIETTVIDDLIETTVMDELIETTATDKLTQTATKDAGAPAVPSIVTTLNSITTDVMEEATTSVPSELTTTEDGCVITDPISAIVESSSLPGIDECSYGDYYISGLGGMATLNTATRCGQCMEVTGPNGVTVTVRVVDTCPFDKCMSWDDIVLSPDSFTDIVYDDATTSADVSYALVACPGNQNIKLKFKESAYSSAFGLVVLDHRYPVTSVTVQSRGGWVTLYRMSNNVFVLPADSEETWTSFNVKVYSDYGHITYRVDQITYNVIIDTGKQFRLCKNGQNVIETTMPQHVTVTDYDSTESITVVVTDDDVTEIFTENERDTTTKELTTTKEVTTITALQDLYPNYCATITVDYNANSEVTDANTCASYYGTTISNGLATAATQFLPYEGAPPCPELNGKVTIYVTSTITVTTGSQSVGVLIDWMIEPNDPVNPGYSVADLTGCGLQELFFMTNYPSAFAGLASVDENGDCPGLTADANPREDLAELCCSTGYELEQNMCKEVTGSNRKRRDVQVEVDVVQEFLWNGTAPVCLDTSPPVIYCPESFLTLTDELEIDIIYPHATATDNVGIASITYEPPNGTTVSNVNYLTVTVTAQDMSGNEATCEFVAWVEPESCPDWSLETPEGGQKACTGLVPGLFGGYSCSLACPSGYDFIQEIGTPGNMYSCRLEGKWHPHNYVPDCVELEVPDYCLTIGGVYTATTSIPLSCTAYYESILEYIIQSLDPQLSVLCSDIADTVQIVLTDTSAMIDGQNVSASISMSVVALPGNTNRTAVSICGERIMDFILTSYNELSSILVIESQAATCPEIILQGSPTEEFQGCCCPQGSITRGCYCLTCTPGTFDDGDACLSCPIGTYQNMTGQTSCQQCPAGYSTLQEHTKNDEECRELCRPGFYSTNGVAPCRRCEIATFQSEYGSTSCTPCPNDTSTYGVAVSESSCRDFCEPGSFSNTGLSPCQQCPRHTYQNDSRATGCEPCPSGMGTLAPGSSSADLCVDYDICVELLPCLSGGTCSSYGPLNYTCECTNLYKGDRCELPALCDSGPCQNGGQCELRFSSYVCSCVDGYIGDLCEIDRDECAFDPCQNGATCNDLVGSYRCDCVPGYQGDQCDEETNECDGDPCDHEIYCEDLLNAFRCECEPGFEGVLCDENIDECAPGPCMNGATCQDGNNAYSCICPNGYEGSRCQNNIDDCIGVNCQNGGTCVDGLEEFTCDCVYGWGGEYCDEQSAPCYPDPCGNNATCVVLIDAEDYVCRCIYGYTGYYCEEEVDECGSNPCKNGANCTDLINSFECSCVAGFSGLTCDVNIDECANVPCENGGICTDLVNGYTCQCPTGYSGQNCDQDTDDCSGDPCENGATCQDAFNAFSCICAAGFEGEICDENINECDEFPCQNNATCIDTIGSYSCQCIDGFDGFFCDNNIDDCQDTCQNGATCHDGLMTFTCECLPAYDGVLCDKEKSADFDLFLTGTDMSMSLSTQYQCINDFSVSLWVRFANAGSTGTFFTIAVYGGENLANEVLIVLDQDVTGVNDGTWHHVALIVSEGAVAIFVDGAPVSSLSWTDVSDQDMCIIVLGQSYDENGALDEYFAFNGDLTQVNVHSQVLSLEDIQLLASNCSNPLGDVILWVQMDQDLTGNVQVVRPSQCGGTSCSIGHTGSDCNTVIDKVPPVVISCPNTTRIINPDSSLSVGEWEEPIFTDDVGVVRVEQTFAIGDTFSWGTYTIGYVAYDAANNSAQCNFLLYVLPFDCEYPDVPVNGLHVCSPFASGHFCVIECLPGKRFVTLPPPYYICGAEGTFDPQNSDVAFTFPGCAAPGRGNQGVNCQMRGNSNAGTCNQGIIGQLIQSFKDTMNYLNTLYGICGGECNFDDLVIECDSARRRKRQTGGSFVINYSFTSNATDVDPSLVIEVAVKDGNFTSGGITIDSDSLVVSTIVICENGSVLAYNNDACVQCPSGEYHDIDSDTCLPCEMGYYQPDEGQTECYKCPDNDITHGRRSIDVSQCVARCTAGHYYDSSASQCEPCKRGYWQDKEGKFVCNTCTKGMLTDEEGATNASQCLEVCKSVGIQLGVSGECEPCQKGTYRSDVDQQVSCIMCPFGFTTEESGADSIDLCNVADCNVGWYLNNGVCEKCPLGTYNPLRHQDRCQSCPEYYTTNTEGALFESECVDAHECRLGTDDCSENAVCRNTVPGYTCTCLPGYMGDGKDCLDVCFDYCFNDGLCEKDSYGNASCNCKRGFKGDRCEVKMGSTSPGISDGQTAIVIGAVAGGVAAILVLGVIILLIYKRFSLSSKEHPGWETQEATMDWVFDDIEDNGDVIDKLKKEEESFNEIFHYNPMYSESAGGSSVDITHKSGSMRTFKSQDESVPDNDAYF